jgi:glycosyltransferase involved in cell wall biosynthesis
MKINILSNKISWFGKYSGYECLTEYLPVKDKLSISIPKYSTINRIIGKVYKEFKNWKNINTYEAFAEIKFIRKIKRNDISHILYLDSHLHSTKNLDKNKDRVIGTIHIPYKFWTEENLDLLSNLDNIIILYEKDVLKFSKYINKDKIHVIKHGVDIDFFKPGNPISIKKNQVLFVGHYLRNFQMFLEVYDIIRNNISEDIEYHFIIPMAHRNESSIQKIIEYKNVFFHERLSDEELLEYYQTSYLLLMPMNESGANTAIVQAIATGLPIITTDVGGIRSYGGGDIFPLVTNNSSEDMARLFSQYFSNEVFRDAIAKKQRQFAVECLDWNIIAKQHYELYEMIINK